MTRTMTNTQAVATMKRMRYSTRLQLATLLDFVPNEEIIAIDSEGFEYDSFDLSQRLSPATEIHMMEGWTWTELALSWIPTAAKAFTKAKAAQTRALNKPDHMAEAKALVALGML